MSTVLGPAFDRHTLIESHLDIVDAIVSCLLRRRRGLLRVANMEKDDLIQEGRIGLIKAADSFKADRGACFKTHATRCIRAALCDALRAAGVQNEFEEADFESTPSSDEAADVVAPFTDRSDLRLMFEQLLPKLSANVRQALQLHFYQGLNKTEVAEQLGISKVHAARLIDRGLAQLKPLVMAH